ncbi:MAG TPA: mandelate racemase/muconate lactonizing enzyme family protein [Candidatus Acidoferrales bacterium]|nr:mandelate racemase/muconate lactonizing enzyme family protein [Candidatus Acidoferrales bacterium]
MKITKIESHVLLVPDYDSKACSSAQDDIVVKIHTDEGIVGIGETDTNPWAAKAFINSPGTHCMALGINDLLIGKDPMDVEALWENVYVSTAMSGRRGLGICVLGALDMALWDVKGKALQKPVWELLGKAKHSNIHPYASLLPNGNTLKEYSTSLREKLLQAKKYGFDAAKLEICINGPYSHNGLQEPDSELVKIVASCREAVGSNMRLMIDVAYAWKDWRTALSTIEAVEPYDVYFMETPLRTDDLEAYATLVERSKVPIAAGEWLQTRFEFHDLIDHGHVKVAQPDVGRVGGLTEARRVAEFASTRDRLVVPHCWKTGIGIAASAHLAVVSSNCPYIEYLPAELSESLIRKELVADELRMQDGVIPLPTKPGLGIELNEKAVAKYTVA